MKSFLSRLRDPERQFVALLERAHVTSDASWRDHNETGADQVAMWQFFLRTPVWVLTSDGGGVFVFELGETPTGMAAFDEQVLRDWWESNPGTNGVGTTRINVSDFCFSMWLLEADSVAVRINPRVRDGFFEVGRDDLAWLGAGLVPWYRVLGQAPPTDAQRAGLTSVVRGVPGLDAARLILTASSDGTGPCLELVVREDLPARDLADISEMVRKRLDTESHEVHRLALVIHDAHHDLPQELVGWPVPME
jgi:hypothetical protein